MILATAANIADLEAKLSRRIFSEMFREFGQQLGLAKLELLGPDGAIDLEFEDAAANSEGPTMGRDLGAHDRFPMNPDSMSERDAIES